MYLATWGGHWRRGKGSFAKPARVCQEPVKEKKSLLEGGYFVGCFVGYGASRRFAELGKGEHTVINHNRNLVIIFVGRIEIVVGGGWLQRWAGGSGERVKLRGRFGRGFGRHGWCICE